MSSFREPTDFKPQPDQAVSWVVMRADHPVMDVRGNVTHYTSRTVDRVFEREAQAERFCEHMTHNDAEMAVVRDWYYVPAPLCIWDSAENGLKEAKAEAPAPQRARRP